MKLKFTNLDEAQQKFHGTFCYYDDKAIYVKSVEHSADHSYLINFAYVGANTRGNCGIYDEKFRYTNYNIGYANFKNAAGWYYRVPARQYKQGLRADQVRVQASDYNMIHEIGFNSSSPIADMMENRYPVIPKAQELLLTGGSNIVAFHKDIAATYDKIHKDFILEYKGGKIGHTHDFKDIKLIDEAAHLNELIRETIRAY